MAKLGEPDEGLVLGPDDAPLPKSLPARIVRPASFGHREVQRILAKPSIKIIDFGEAFLSDDISSTLNTPLPVRAPEIVFGDKLDHRVDLWSTGCLVSVFCKLSHYSTNGRRYLNSLLDSHPLMS